MSPPLMVTEDTPPDMLTGHMDLRLVLPNGTRVRMSVDRRTPMMDLLVQVTTAYKISPAGHVLQPYGECGLLPYKPSTPIGALDTWTVHIVPKHQALQNPASKISLKQVQQPFETTFRFQVNLPKNQLYVTRVTGRTMMREVLLQACSEKNLDPNKYTLRHPKHLDRPLCDELSLMEYGHNQVSMVSNKLLPSAVSSEDILAMAAYSGKSSESSSRSLSPDSSVSPGAPVQPSRPLRKRRPAPKPPVQPAPPPKKPEAPKDPPSNGPVICHSRTSSDSSGYHEASVLSESPDSNNSSLPDSLPRRSKLPSKSEPKPSNKLSRSLSNLHHESTAPTTSMKPAQSTSCLAPSRKKKPAPPPPVLAIAEEEKEEVMPVRSSRTLPPGARLIEDSPVEIPTRPSDLNSRLSHPPVAPSVESKGKPYSCPVDVSPTHKSTCVSPERSSSVLSYSPIQDKSSNNSVQSSPNHSPQKLFEANATPLHILSSVIQCPARSDSGFIESQFPPALHPNKIIPPDQPLLNHSSSPPVICSARISTPIPPSQHPTVPQIPTSPLFKELNSTLKQAQVAPDTQLISVRDLLKKFADSEKPLPNFKLTTYNSNEVRKITKYSESGTSYYNYDLNNVRTIDVSGSPAKRSSILKISNPSNTDAAREKRMNENNITDSNDNKIVDVYSDMQLNKDAKRIVHTKKGGGTMTSNIRNIYERGDSEDKAVDNNLQEELDNISGINRVKHIVEVYSDSRDSFESETSDGKKPQKLILYPTSTPVDVSNNNHEVETSNHNTEVRRRSFFEEIISDGPCNENLGVRCNESTEVNCTSNENGIMTQPPVELDEDDFSEKEFSPVSQSDQQSGSFGSSFDSGGEAVIEEINRALDSVAYADEDSDDDYDYENRFGGDSMNVKNTEFKVSPVIGVQKIEDVFDEYASEFTNIPIVIIKDEDESEHPFDRSLGSGSIKGELTPPPQQEFEIDLNDRPRSPLIDRPLSRPKSPLHRTYSDSTDTMESFRRFERSDSTEIGGFEGPKSGMFDDVIEDLERDVGPSVEPKICYAKEESLEIEILKDFTEPRDDNISMSSTSSDKTTAQDIKDNHSTIKPTADGGADLNLPYTSTAKGKSVTFSPQPKVRVIPEEDSMSVSSQQSLSKKKSAIFSPKIKFEDLKRRGKKLFGSMKKSKDGSSDWNHKDLTEPGICDCEDPDVIYVRVPKSGKRNQAFKIKDKRTKKVTFARSNTSCSDGESVNRRLKNFLESKEGELV